MIRLCAALAFGSLFTSWAIAGDTSSDAAAALSKAHKAEALGNVAERNEYLARALESAPNDSNVRWQNGFVRLGSKWVKADDYYRHAPVKAALDDYRELRKKSAPTVESQLKLADFCKSRSLKDQELVHLSAVVELEPDHAAARQRLGHQRIDGEWRSKEEIDNARATVKKIAEALRKHRGELNGIREGLERGSLSKREAMERLGKNKIAAIIPAWERFVSSDSAIGSETVVEVLTTMTEDEASLSLVRHALYSPYPAAATAAVEALKNRSEHSYMPAVLAALRSRWISTMEVLQQANNRVVFRYTMYADGDDKQQMSVFEDVFFLRGFVPDAARQTAGAAGIRGQTIEQRRSAENKAIEENNARVMKLLKDITGETTADSPQTWWQWWCDRNGIYFEGDKPLEQSYAANYTSIVGTPPLPPSGGTTTTGTRDPKDCLAGGTPVWTDRGPVAVDRVKMGDLVLARDVRTGELAFKPVLRTTVRAPERLYRIQTDKDSLRASGGHPFWVSGKGWIKARDLAEGMVLYGTPSPAVIKEVTEEEKPVRSFNLVVADCHTYFAGSTHVLSHDNSIRDAR